MIGSHHAAEPWRLLASIAGLVAAVAFFWGPLGATLTDLRLIQGRAPGFHAEVASSPQGAQVVIQGKARGTTPWIGNVQCSNDEEVVIQVLLKGFQPWVRNPLCREGKTLEITARLKALDSSSQ